MARQCRRGPDARPMIEWKQLRVNMHIEWISTECECGQVFFFPFTPNDIWMNGTFLENWKKENRQIGISVAKKTQWTCANVIRLHSYSGTLKDSWPIVFSQGGIIGIICVLSVIDPIYSSLKFMRIAKKISSRISASLQLSYSQFQIWLPRGLDHHSCPLLSQMMTLHCMLIWKQRLLMVIQEAGNQIKAWQYSGGG